MLLTLALFAFWALVGSATLWLLERRLPALRMALIAPTIGVVVHVLGLFLPNFAGVPVRLSAWPVAIGLTLASLLVLWKTRPAVPWRRLAAFGPPMLAGLLLVGSPMLKFGTDWVSYCNDDMANYCLGAQRVMQDGYFGQPSQDAIHEGKDYPQLLWFLHVPSNYRPGSELLVAGVAVMTGKMPVEIYMATVLALHLTLMAAAGGLVAYRDDLRPAAVATCWLIAASSLGALGALYQLIAQVCGLGLISAGATLTMRAPEPGVSMKRWGREALLLGLFGAGVLVIYPEISPFLGLAYLIYMGIAVARGRAKLWPVARIAIVAVGIAIVVINIHAIPTVTFLIAQVSGGASSDVPELTLFPYYLMPSGLANLWGFQSLASPLPDEPWGSLLILAGFALFVLAGAAGARLAWRGHPVGAVACVMLAMSLYLFRNGSGFGLFKLAMYSQPYFLGALAVGWWRWASTSPRLVAGGRALKLAPLMLLGVSGLYVQQQYVRASEGVGRGFNELVDASRSHAFDQARAAVSSPAPATFISDAYNITAAKFQMMNALGRSAAFPSNRFMPPSANLMARYLGHNAEQINDANFKLLSQYANQYPYTPFYINGIDLPPGESPRPADQNYFMIDTLAGRLSTGAETLVATTGRQSPFNRRHTGYQPAENFVARPVAQARNHLVYVASRMGQPYFYNGTDPTVFALYQLERDAYFFPEHTMAGIGRYLLFRVINPTEKLRIVFDLTSSYRSDGENLLPNIDAIGKQRVHFVYEPGDPSKRTPAGRGSARLVSPPIEPQMIGGNDGNPPQPYVCVDLGEFGKPFPAIRNGLMKLYGTKVAIDRRQLVAFCRDLSAVSEEEYASFRPPSSVQHFLINGQGANDLSRLGLEYRGLYEDGWVPEQAEVTLYQPQGAKYLTLRGAVPEIAGVSQSSFTTEAAVLIDGREVARKSLSLGAFEIKAQLPANDPTISTGGRRRVMLRFTNTQRLSGADRRPVACTLHYLGFETPSSAPSRIQAFPADVADPQFKRTGLYDDGWMPKKSSVSMTQLADHGFLSLKGMVPKIDDDGFRTDVVVTLDGKELARKQVGLDGFEIRVPVPPMPGYRTIEVTYSNVQTLPGADGRSVGALLKSLAFEPGDEE